MSDRCAMCEGANIECGADLTMDEACVRECSHCGGGLPETAYTAGIRSSLTFYMAQHSKIKAELTALKAKLPEYQPGDVVWAIAWDAKYGWKCCESGSVVGNVVSVSHGGERTTNYKQSWLYPTQEAAQAACDERNGK